MQRTCPCVLGVVLALLLLPAPTTFADDQLILGRLLVVTKNRVLVFADELSSPNTIVGDPRIGGATLTVFAHGGTSASQTIALPAAYWSQTFQHGYGFSPRGQADPVRFVRIRRSFTGRFVMKALLRRALGSLDIVPPNPGDDAGMVLSIGDGDRYCTTLGGAAGGTEKVDNETKWRVVFAAVEVPCGSPSGAFLE